MKIITTKVPESYLRLLESMVPDVGASRSEIMRIAIREFLRNELIFIEEFKKTNKSNKTTYFFNYCINCGRKLYGSSLMYHSFHKKVEVFKLRFCCSCYNLFKDKTIEDFPEELIEKIKKNIDRFKKRSSIS